MEESGSTNGENLLVQNLRSSIAHLAILTKVQCTTEGWLSYCQS
jgi:hypothetical protein